MMLYSLKIKPEQEVVPPCRLGSTECSSTAEGGAANALPGGLGLWQPLSWVSVGLVA